MFQIKSHSQKDSPENGHILGEISRYQKLCKIENFKRQRCIYESAKIYSLPIDAEKSVS